MEQLITLAISITHLSTVLFLCGSFLKNTKKFATSRKGIEMHDIKSLPSVSVCVPARNETHDLSDCLSKIVATNYPKLEVLVLDDCSQDKTSQIIRSFAHDGVRFIKGNEPAEGWLGKNNAYELLYQQTRGQYLVFVSVETIVESDTFEKMIDYMLRHRIDMMSVLPIKTSGNFISLVASPLRFFWQLVLPLSLSTPVASQLWAIKTQALRDMNGFVSIKDEILPENKIATRLKKEKKYHFINSDQVIKATSIKSWKTEIESSIRIWSPVLKKNPLYALLAAFGHLVMFATPLIILLRERNADTVTLASFFALFAGMATLVVIVRYLSATTEKKLLVFFGLVSLPYVLAQEIVLIVLSFYRYKRGVVEWKGRNICYPKRPIV